MTVDSVSLSSAERGNLLSLQGTSNQLTTDENELSTGKKVNSAIDNATAYFSSQGFLNSANDLSNVSDGLSTALQTVQSASSAIDSITTVVNQLQGLTTSALATTDTTTRSSYATQYNALLTQLNELVNDATFNGTNLLSSTDNHLVVNFNENNTSSLTIAGVDLSSTGLSLNVAAGGFGSDANINTSVNALTSALSTIRSDSATFGDNATLIEARQTFTSNLINSLQSASDSLVLADTNQVGADVTALETSSQLGVDALSISNQASQYVLKLFS